MSVKKVLLIADFVLCALFLTLFISCSDSIDANEDVDAVARVSFSQNSIQTRSLEHTIDAYDFSSLYWFYTAEKTDSYGSCGETLDEIPVKTDSDGNPSQGLDGNEVGGFSLGTWTFTLSAYREADKTDILYKGKKTDVVLCSGHNTVGITVNPQIATGRVILNDLVYTPYGSTPSNIKIGISLENEIESYKATLSSQNGNFTDCFISTVENTVEFLAGVYACSFLIYEDEVLKGQYILNDVVIASGAITTISGSLSSGELITVTV